MNRRKDSPLRILIFEPYHNGHRFTYVRVLIRALSNALSASSADYSIELATTESARLSKEFDELLAGISHLFTVREIEEIPAGLSPTRDCWCRYKLLCSCLSNQQVDHLYVPSSDGLVQMSAIFSVIPGFGSIPRKLRAETLMLGASVGYDSQSLSRRLLFFLAIRLAPFHRIHLIDPIVYEYILHHWLPTPRKVRLIPDPITNTKQMARGYAREVLGLPSQGRLIGCVGLVNERKGADLLLAGFAGMNREENDYLVFAGRHSDVIRDSIKNFKEHDPCLKIISIDRYLTEKELSASVCALDVMVALYPSFVGSASFVLRAASVNCISLGAQHGWMGEIIPRFGLGHVCDLGDSGNIISAIKQTLHDAMDYELSELGKEFVKYNSGQNMDAHWTSFLMQYYLDQDVELTAFPS